MAHHQATVADIMIRVSVILANLMNKYGRLNVESAVRVDCAVAHDSLGESSIFLLCGWAYREDSEIAIADAMHEYIRKRYPSISPRVICQRASRDTVGDALFSRIYLDRLAHGSRYSVKVFTSDYHVERTTEIFNFFFCKRASVSVIGAQGFKSEKLIQKEAESLRAFRDTFQGVPPGGDVEHALSILREKHPFYNGRTYSAIGEIDSAQLASLPKAASQ